ncbi:hypothetical protein [Cohnella lupini]|uniref:Lipoprotein n=1 Tax=Cohnella lupini TaxID=1294267 RepID=A0A3D9I779_9BACL|nr:hypothetical protein [Cohnella lupini]RED57530.1 hypothetical protein DFP95_1102 [Cohnella lupini]
MTLLKTLLLTVSFSLCLVACNGATPFGKKVAENDKILNFMKSDTSDSTYRTYKTIKNSKIFAEVALLLMKSDESNATVSMTRAPDRKISLVITRPTASVEPRIYGIWFMQKSTQVAVVSESSGGGYIQLNKEQSHTILSLLN